MTASTSTSPGRSWPPASRSRCPPTTRTSPSSRTSRCPSPACASTATPTSRLVAGDFDGDGDQDLAVAGPNDRVVDISVLANDGKGTFSDPTLWVSIPNAVIDVVRLYPGDFDKDGDTDLWAQPARRAPGRQGLQQPTTPVTAATPCSRPAARTSRPVRSPSPATTSRPCSSATSPVTAPPTWSG
ncbi:hypothetical protein G5V59_11815 [Nocardioides sp. W3-2-3]|nr:hypothetical protein [Nocardioides convexus]